MKKTAGSILLATALLTRAAVAAPMNYDEAVTGDLAGLPSSAWLLGAGDNTFAGWTHLNVNFPNAPHFDSDFDSVSFTVPNGLHLADAGVSYSVTTTNASKSQIEMTFCAGTGACGFVGPILGFQTIDLLALPPTPLSLLTAPLGSGTYTLYSNGLSIAPLSPTAPEGWTAHYVLHFHLVPEPGALALLATALVAWLLARRRPRAMARRPA